MWGVAGVWHKLVMANFYSLATHASHEGTGIIFLAYLVLALFMVGLYAYGAPRRRPVLEGLLLGVVIGLLWVLPHGLAMAGAHDEPLPYVFKNAAWHGIEQGAGGIIIGLILGQESRSRRDR